MLRRDWFRVIVLGGSTQLAGLPHSYALPSSPGKFSFCAIGDTPYITSDISNLKATFEAAVREDCSFITHIGDIKSSWEPCSDALVRERIELLNSSRLPLFFVPGDNEWTDCAEIRAGLSFPPEQRLEFLRSLTAREPNSLGQNRWPLERQANALGKQLLPENIRWFIHQCAFVGINLSGSFNGINIPGIDEGLRLEREAASNNWLLQSVSWAHQLQAKAMVILIHANPRLEGGVEGEGDSPRQRFAYRGFKRALKTVLKNFNKPVLLIHGDTHHFKVNNPWSEDHANLTRLEVFGSPFTASWTKVTVDTHGEQATIQIIPLRLND